MPQKTILKRPETGRKAVRETKAELTARIDRILTALDREYGTQYRCYVNYETPWQLLIAVIMSAQCTDARVNTITPELFRRCFGQNLCVFCSADIFAALGGFHAQVVVQNTFSDTDAAWCDL